MKEHFLLGRGRQGFRSKAAPNCSPVDDSQNSRAAGKDCEQKAVHTSGHRAARQVLQGNAELGSP